MNLFDNLIDLTDFKTINPSNKMPTLENQLNALQQFDSLVNEFNLASKQQNKIDMYKIVKKMRVLHGQTIKQFYKQLLTQNDMETDDYLLLSTVDTAYKNMHNVITQSENILKKNNNTAKSDKLVGGNINNKNPINKFFKDIDPNLPTIILYFKDWCGHCKQFKPVWKEFINITDKKSINIVMTDNDDIIRENNIDGFPTVELQINGNKATFNGDRSIRGLADFTNAALNKEVSKPLAN
jgi:thiol-disulfide isomerase/thioredoxin